MGAAGALVLPQLPSFPSRWRGGLHGAEKQSSTQPVRMVCIANEFGYHAPSFFPKTPGKNFEWTRLLEPLKQHHQDMTVISGLDHDHKGGHFAVHAFLSGVKETEVKTMPEGNLSLDQKAAEHVGPATRFPSLAIGSYSGLHGGCRMCWTRSGARIPPIPGPRELYQALFYNESESSKVAVRARMNLKSSILDSIYADAKMLSKQLDQHDKQKLEEYFSSIRDVEKKLVLNRHWAKVSKPKTSMPEPSNGRFAQDLELIYDLMVLALQTDSTRIATLEIGGTFSASDIDVKKGYHALSHHGHVQEAIDQLVQIERYQMEKLSYFLSKLKATQVGGESLLKHTMVLNGSGMGNGNAHTNYNLPLVLAGGGFKHGEYKAYPLKKDKLPLGNLFVSMLQRFGVETDVFHHGKSSLRGLEVA
jgi:hypothetical protein